jgi:hypothetical protein
VQQQKWQGRGAKKKVAIRRRTFRGIMRCPTCITTMRRVAFPLKPEHSHTGSPGGNGHATASVSLVPAVVSLLPAVELMKRARTTATPVIVGGTYENMLAGVMAEEATGVVEPAPEGRMTSCTKEVTMGGAHSSQVNLWSQLSTSRSGEDSSSPERASLDRRRSSAGLNQTSAGRKRC